MIILLINDLRFIKDKTHWGAPFCFGTLEIPEQDFRLIAGMMADDKSLFDKWKLSFAIPANRLRFSDAIFLSLSMNLASVAPGWFLPV